MRYDPAIRQRALERLAATGLGPAHRKMIELTGSDKRVLEIGCASGYVSRELSENGCRVTGVEIDRQMGEQAAEYLDQVVIGNIERPSVRADVSALTAKSGRFDVILCGDVLEHLVDPADSLRWFRDQLADSGYVLATVPNVAFFTMRWSLLRGRFQYADCGLLDRTHLRFYTFFSFAEMVEEAGYRVSEYWVTDGRLPLRRIWSRAPILGAWIAGREQRWVRRWPNLLAYHLLFKLIPSGGS